MGILTSARSPRLIGALVVLVLLISACGGATQPAPAETAPTAAPAAAAPTAAPAAAEPTAAPAAAEPTAAPAAQPASDASGSLMVLDWSGYEDPELWKPFAEQHPNVKVDFSFFAENPEALTKVQSGFEADLVHPCSSYYGLFVDAGLMQPIDTSRLKNWSGVVAKLAEEGQINGQQYFIPWDWGYEAILVRTDKIPNPPKSWADLWKPEYAGHLALQDAGEANFVTVAHMLGFDPWNTTEEQNAQVKQKLGELTANTLTYWSDSTALEQQVAAGDVWIAANVWPDVYLNLKSQGVPVEYITPTEGRLGWLCGYGVLSSSKNLDLAYAYLDALIAPESMAYMSNQFAYGAANADALPLTDEQVVKDLQLDQPDIFASTVFYKAVSSERNELFNSTWSEVKAGT
jgi:spermidine/putrescine transport system substrate-binding protein